MLGLSGYKDFVKKHKDAETDKAYAGQGSLPACAINVQFTDLLWETLSE